MYAFGDGAYGKLGVYKDCKIQTLPQKVGMLNKKFRKNKIYYQVCAGSTHSMALSDNGLLFTWGYA